MNLDDINPIAEISKAVRLHRQLAEKSIADLETALPVLTETLSRQSGQSAKAAGTVNCATTSPAPPPPVS